MGTASPVAPEIRLSQGGPLLGDRVSVDEFRGQPVRFGDVVLIPPEPPASLVGPRPDVHVIPEQGYPPESALFWGSGHSWLLGVVAEAAEPDVTTATFWIWLYDEEGRALGSSSTTVGPRAWRDADAHPRAGVLPPGRQVPWIGPFESTARSARFARVSCSSVSRLGGRPWQPQELEGCRIPMQIPRYPAPPWHTKD